MLEIILVIWLSTRLAALAREKGLSGAWGFLFAGAWVGGEILAGFTLAFFTNSLLILWPASIAGGILGGIAAWSFVASLPGARFVAEQDAYAAMAMDPTAVGELGVANGSPATTYDAAPMYAAASLAGASQAAAQQHRAGYCMDCGKNVWLTDGGACPAGHGPQSITNCYAA
jgi:hypothetical protein